MNTPCNSFESLTGAYLDGELSEAQAGPLRRHLLDCAVCRRRVSGEKALKRWFQPVAETVPAVPAGFAARVARRAFAGDPGLEVPAPTAEDAPVLRFVLGLTAAAAVLLLMLSGSIRSVAVPTGGALGADDDVPMKLEQVLGEADRLQEAEAALATSGREGRGQRAEGAPAR